MSTITTTDDGTATAVVSLTRKQPFPTLTVIIVVLVVGVVVILCCILLYVYRCKRKRKGILKTTLKNHDTNTDHDTSDIIAGSSSGLQVYHELKAIVIQSNNACAQEDSHTTTHGNVLNNSHVAKEVSMSSDGYLVPQEMIINAEHLEVRNYSNLTSFESTVKHSNQNKAKTEISNPSGKSPQEHMDSLTPCDTAEVSDIYATVDKSKEKNKTTEVVYAQVNENPQKSGPQEHMDLQVPSDTVGKENIQVSGIYATVDKSKKKNKTTEVVYAQVNENPQKSGPQEHMDLQVPSDTMGKENIQVSGIYATVDKSKKKNETTEVAYAQVNKSTKKPANQDLVTYAELSDFNHDVTRSIPNAPPPYHPTKYASVSSK